MKKIDFVVLSFARHDVSFESNAQHVGRSKETPIHNTLTLFQYETMYKFILLQHMF
jgi:hypothetical protein